MDKYLVLKPPNPNLKRAAEDLLAQQDAKKTSLNKPETAHEKINIPIHNQYEALPIDRELNQNSNTSAKNNDQEAGRNEATVKNLKNASTLVKKTGHIPPIILAIKPDWTHESIKSLVSNYTSRFHLQYRSNKKVAVYCYSPEAHKALREGLKANDAPFLTYTRKDERSPKLVVKGLPDYAEEVIPHELKNLGFDGVTVTKLKSAKNKNTQCPPFLIQLANGANRKEPAQCCNCKEAHPANYSKCNARLSYLEKTKQKKAVERHPPPPTIKKQNPWFTKIITEPSSACLTENISETNLHQYSKQNTSTLQDSDAATKEMLDILVDNGNRTTDTIDQCEALAKAFYNNMSLTLSWVSPEVEQEVRSSNITVDNYSDAELLQPTHPRKLNVHLKYVDGYGTYRLPQHYVLFPANDELCPQLTSQLTPSAGRGDPSVALDRVLARGVAVGLSLASHWSP
ncbi:hypothetical protein NE865_09180 [Phthorimaea operculella]|nr:hypothetical protein NE865_09180 [Phthorimaea operculella]